MSTPDPTPWVDARAFALYGGFPRSIIESEYARTLERHLRRIVEAWERPVGLQHTELTSAINAAKEELLR